MRPTVKDVAKQAGVSPKTVSNVINGMAFVRPDNRSRVEVAIETLGFVPNLSARGLRNGRSGLIALALTDLAAPYAGEIAHHFIVASHAHGWGVQIEESGSDPEREAALISRGRSHLIDGLILNPVALSRSAMSLGIELPPLVLIGEVEQEIADQVCVDSVAAAREMTDLLIRRGARSIAIVGAPEERLATATSLRRMEGYSEALANAGIPIDPTLQLSCPDWTSRSAAAVVGDFLNSHPIPDAFFCFTDTLALGALAAIRGSGYRVPEDTMLAGFDDLASSAYMVPSLTTVSFDKQAFADAALSRLAVRIKDRREAPRTVVIPHHVIERVSTRR